MVNEISAPDPFLRSTPLDLQDFYYPLGFPLELQTNSPEIARAAKQNWGGRPQTFEKPVLQVRVIAGCGDRHPCAPVYRGQKHLMAIVSDHENFAFCDYTQHFAFCHLNAAASADSAFSGYYFLEAMANFSLTQLYLTPVHGACVARNGQAVLLCGPSGAGKTSLAYYCARRGWTYISDNESWLVRAGGLSLIGNPRRIRFREDAAQLFPELKDLASSPHPNGKMSIEVNPGAVGLENTAYQGCVDRLVFLSRHSSAGSVVRRMECQTALGRLLSELPVYEDWVREEQQNSLERIAELNPVELRYGSLESAYRQLENLIH